MSLNIHKLFKYIRLKCSRFSPSMDTMDSSDIEVLKRRLICPEKIDRVDAQSIQGIVCSKFKLPALGLTEYSTETYMVDLEQAYVYKTAGFIFNNKRELVYDISRPIGNKNHKDISIYRQLWFPKELNLSTGVTLLISNNDANNYYHWLFDVLPKIYLLEQSGYSYNDFDQILIGHSDKRFQIESLNMLNFPFDNAITIGENQIFKCKNLVAFSKPCLSGNVPKWIVSFLRERLIKSITIEPFRLIYISRSDAKNKREDFPELDEVARNIGFETIILSEFSLSEQIKLFQEAKVVMGIHGAGFSNIIFSNKGLKVIEFFQSDYINQCFWTLASHVDASYHYFINENRSENDYLQLEHKINKIVNAS